MLAHPVFYLGIMIYGGFSSSAYSLKYDQTNYSAWAPPNAPIKINMTVGLVLMLLQAFSNLFRDLGMTDSSSREPTDERAE